MSDSEGLFLQIMPSGSKYWRLKYYFGVKEKLLALGIYPEVSLGEARQRRQDARKMLATGNDPSEAKREARRQIIKKQENNFESLAREWHGNREHRWSAGHAKRILKRLEFHVFDRIGSRPIADITTSDLLSVMRKVEEHGNETAHRVLQLCGQVFNYAVITDRATTNPAIPLRGALKPVVRNNHAYIKPNELKEYLAKLDTYDGSFQTKSALRFLLLTRIFHGTEAIII